MVSSLFIGLNSNLSNYGICGIKSNSINSADSINSSSDNFTAICLLKTANLLPLYSAFKLLTGLAKAALMA